MLRGSHIEQFEVHGIGSGELLSLVMKLLLMVMQVDGIDWRLECM
jgi:hypothetical protein